MAVSRSEGLLPRRRAIVERGVARLEEIARMTRGSNEPGWVAPRRAAIATARWALRQAPDLFCRAGIYPTADGGVVLEGGLLDLEFTVMIDRVGTIEIDAKDDHGALLRCAKIRDLAGAYVSRASLLARGLSILADDDAGEPGVIRFDTALGPVVGLRCDPIRHRHGSAEFVGILPTQTGLQAHKAGDICLAGLMSNHDTFLFKIFPDRPDPRGQIVLKRYLGDVKERLLPEPGTSWMPELWDDVLLCLEGEPEFA